MSWILFLQIAALMYGAGALVEYVAGSIIEKRRDDAFRRKDGGL